MPNITFILPHWIYWGGLLLVPAAFMLATRYMKPSKEGLSLPLAYMFWLISGFMGIHRLYLKSWPAAIFIALFVGIIAANYEGKILRNAHSIAKNEAFNATYDLNQAIDEGRDEQEIVQLQDDASAKEELEAQLAAQQSTWRTITQYIAIAILALLLIDGLLLPRLVRAARARQSPASESIAEPPSSLISPLPDKGFFGRVVSRTNAFTGEFASYWTVIAVFVFYYEVIARYIFNSPTIWAHESMYLLFGAQYMLAGGFCLRENAHVRVDVLYMRLSARTKAWADTVTSFFFFLFTISLIVTGWTFFHDSFVISQVSHSEWEISYWPIKLSLPVGGALLVTQGFVHLLKDIETLRNTPK